jgi:hypothetical protein
MTKKYFGAYNFIANKLGGLRFSSALKMKWDETKRNETKQKLV